MGDYAFRLGERSLEARYRPGQAVWDLLKLAALSSVPIAILSLAMLLPVKQRPGGPWRALPAALFIVGVAGFFAWLFLLMGRHLVMESIPLRFDHGTNRCTRRGREVCSLDRIGRVRLIGTREPEGRVRRWAVELTAGEGEVPPFFLAHFARLEQADLAAAVLAEFLGVPIDEAVINGPEAAR